MGGGGHIVLFKEDGTKSFIILGMGGVAVLQTKLKLSTEKTGIIFLCVLPKWERPLDKLFPSPHEAI